MNRRDMLLSAGEMVVSASRDAIACSHGTAVAQNTPVGMAGRDLDALREQRGMDLRAERGECASVF